MEKSCGAIIIDNNKVLLVKQKKGHYSFPKGHMKLNEEEVETAKRETKEETNIDIEIDDLTKRYRICFMNGKIEKEVIFFLAKPLTYDIKKQECEISDIIWVNIDEVYDTLTYDNMKELWLKVLKDI